MKTTFKMIIVAFALAFLRTLPLGAQPAGLLNQWLADGNAADSSGTNHGTLVEGVGYAAGYTGQGFLFDGDTGRVLVGSLSITQNQFTAMAWVRRTRLDRVSSEGQGAAILAGGVGNWAFAFNNDASLTLTKVNFSNVSTPGPVVTDTNLHHLAVTMDGSAVNIYRDGAVVYTATYNVAFSFSTPHAIGSLPGDEHPQGLHAPIDAVLDDVRLYNRALTPEEIVALFPSGPKATLFGASQSGSVFRFQVGQFFGALPLPALTNASLQVPSGLAVSANNELFVVNRNAVDGGNGSVSRFLDAVGSPVLNGVISGGFNTPHGAAFRGSELLVVDSWNNRVRRFSFNNGLPEETIAITNGLGGTLSRYAQVAPGGNEVFVSQCCAASEYRRYLIGGDGSITPNGVISGNGLNNPHGIAFSAAGEMFVANAGTSSILRFTFSNGVAIANGALTGNGLNQPVGLTFSPWGELFAANFASPVISRWVITSNGMATANGFLAVPATVIDVAFINSVGGPAFNPFCTNLTVLLAAESTNCVVSTNAVTNATTVVSGLIDWLKADGDALDATGNNHAVSFAVGYESGRYNQAFSFSPQPYTGNANGRRVDLGALVQLYGATGFTFSAWVKLPQPVTDWAFPFTFPTVFPNANAPLPGQDKAYNQFGLNIGASNNLAPNFTIGFSNGVIRSAGTGVPIPLNTWVHLAVTWRNSDGQLRMFQNGTGGVASFGGAGSTLPVATQRNLNGTALSASLGVWDFVGGTGGPDTVIERYTGEALTMDDVRIYTRALSPAEIQHIVASEPPEIIESGETNCTVIPAQTTNLTFCAASAGKLKILDTPPGQVELRWSSFTNAYYLLESSAGLVPVDWTNAWGAGLGNGTNVSVLAPKAPQAQRFYRLLSTEP